MNLLIWDHCNIPVAHYREISFLSGCESKQTSDKYLITNIYTLTRCNVLLGYEAIH